jgi:predicted RNA polymerase sigma factor
VALYGELMSCAPSPVVELNRAVAVSMASGPAAALVLVDGLVTDGHLARYHLLHAARGDMLARLDRLPEARVEFERAAAMTANAREKALLLERARDAGAR